MSDLPNARAPAQRSQDEFQLSVRALFDPSYEWPDWAKIACENGRMIVRGTDGLMVEIYDETGRKVGTARFGDFVLRLPEGELAARANFASPAPRKSV